MNLFNCSSVKRADRSQDTAQAWLFLDRQAEMRIIAMFLETSPQSLLMLTFCQPDEMWLKHSFVSSLLLPLSSPGNTWCFISHEGLSTGLVMCMQLPTGKQQYASAGGWLNTPLSKAPAPAALLDHYHLPPSQFDHNKRSSPSQHTPLSSPGMESQCWKTGGGNAPRFNTAISS